MEDLFADDAMLASPQKTPTTENVELQAPPEKAVAESEDTPVAAAMADDDLFGDDALLEDEEANTQDNADAEAQQQIITEFSVPNHKVPGDAGEDLFLAKLPSFLDFSGVAFDRDAILAEIQQSAEASVDNDEKIVKKKSLLNTIRWKLEEGPDGTVKKVSNARFVKWSDGSMSLQVGDELFDVPRKVVTKDHSYLTLMHPEDGILRTVRRFTKSMTFQPYGLSSKSHAELKADIARRSLTSKGRTVKIHATLTNPEQMQKDAIKAESERLKARRRLDNQKSKAMNHEGNTDRTRLTANYLDDSDDELGEGRRRGGYLDDNEDGFVEDDEDDAIEAGAGRLQALKEAGAKRYNDTSKTRKRDRLDDDDDDELSEDESIVYEDNDGDDLSEEEEAVMTPKGGRSPESRPTDSRSDASKSTKKVKRRIAESDDEDDE